MKLNPQLAQLCLEQLTLMIDWSTESLFILHYDPVFPRKFKNKSLSFQRSLNLVQEQTITQNIWKIILASKGAACKQREQQEKNNFITS